MARYCTPEKYFLLHQRLQVESVEFFNVFFCVLLPLVHLLGNSVSIQISYLAGKLPEVGKVQNGCCVPRDNQSNASALMGSPAA